MKALIKVPLVLLENLTFLAWPGSRPFVERHVYNPYNFSEKHIIYSKKKFKEFRNRTEGLFKFEGKKILELGPGGSLGFGLLSLEEGAKKYFALDNGLHTFLTEAEQKNYGKLIGSKKRLFENYFVRNNEGISWNPRKIQYLSLSQDSSYPLIDNSVDLIYSCAVLEHVHDLDICFKEMARVLKPGGLMSHEVDLRDHIFSQSSLWYLSISDTWFRRLFSRSGTYVNRKRIDYFRKLAKKYRLDILEIEPVNIGQGKGVNQAIRKKYPDDDFSILSFNLIARKQ